MALEEKILQELQEIKEAAAFNAKQVLTMEEAARFMGVSKSNLYKLVSEKRVPYYKSAAGRLTYFKREELAQWLTAVRVPTGEELEAQAVARAIEKGGAV